MGTQRFRYALTDPVIVWSGVDVFEWKDGYATGGWRQGLTLFLCRGYGLRKGCY